MACGAGAQRAARPLHIIGKSLTQAWKIDRCGSRGILVFPAASKDRSENPPSLWSWFSEHQICGVYLFVSTSSWSEGRSLSVFHCRGSRLDSRIRFHGFSPFVVV